VSISTPVSCAMKPIIEKITSPANTLVPQLIKGTIIASLKQKINIKGRGIRGCSFLPEGRMALSCFYASTVSFINKKGVELFQIGRDKTIGQLPSSGLVYLFF
jgi:hypothetical protein